MKKKNIAFVLQKVLPYALILTFDIEAFIITSDGQVVCFLFNGSGIL